MATEQRRHAQTERYTAGRDERNLDGTQRERIKDGSRQVRVAGSKDSPQGTTLRRAADDVENLRVPLESLSHRTGQEVSRASGENRRPHHRCSQRRPGHREPGIEHAAVLRPGPRDAKRKCGGVDREKSIPRGRSRGIETDPGRIRLAMWSKLGDLRFPQGSDIVVVINKMEEDVNRYQKMAGENLSETIKRGILMKALTNETELQKHVFRNSTRLETYEKMRQEVMSALTAERAVHEPTGDESMEIGAVGKKKGKGKSDQKGGGKSPGKGKGTGTPNPHADRECFYCQHQRGVQIPYRRREGQQIQGRERQAKGQTIQSKGKETSEFVGRERRNERQQQQSRRSSGTVGALQARMIFAVRATQDATTSSSEVADVDIPERMRLAPLGNALMLDSGAQVGAVPRQQIDELHYNPGPSKGTGLEGISGEDIPRYGHVELNLRRGQNVVQVGAEVADIEHGIIATDAIVKRGRSVLHSPAGHWIVDGTLGPHHKQPQSS